MTEARHGADGHLRNRESTFSESQGNYSSLLGASFGRWAGHIMNVNGEPAVVAMLSIVPNLDPHLLRGDPHMLVSVVKIDRGFVADVGRSLLISDLSVSSHPSSANGAISEPFLADDGAPLGYLTWTPKQPGNPLLMFILPLVAFGVIGAGILTWTMILRLQKASDELADREAQSRHQALHDALSGLPNRHNFVERLQELLDGLVQTRNNGRVIVAYVDVDRFKDVNDTMGHQAGDALIMAVAGAPAARVGPERFPGALRRRRIRGRLPGRRRRCRPCAGRTPAHRFRRGLRCLRTARAHDRIGGSGHGPRARHVAARADAPRRHRALPRQE